MPSLPQSFDIRRHCSRNYSEPVHCILQRSTHLITSGGPRGFTTIPHMDRHPPSIVKCKKQCPLTPTSDIPDSTCSWEKCEAEDDAALLTDMVVEEDSVHPHVAVNASDTETRGDVPFDAKNQSSNSQEGRRLECGRFYTISNPGSYSTPSVHFLRHYFMLNAVLE
jgi:hypothetical protein